MNTKSFLAAAALAFAAGGALADDITIAHETFTPTLSRQAVAEQVRQAHAAGVTSFVTEAGVAATVPAAAVEPMTAAQRPLLREQVRAEARLLRRGGTQPYNWAA